MYALSEIPTPLQYEVHLTYTVEPSQLQIHKQSVLIQPIPKLI